MVLPSSATTNDQNHLVIGGCDCVDLAEEFGTPLFVYDENMVREKCREFRQAFLARSEATEVIYAGKAFMCLAMCRTVQEEGLSLEVFTGGELSVARKAGFPPERIYLTGNNKSREELELALDMGIKRIVVDSFTELDILDRLAGERKLKAQILLRITPGVEAHTHSFIQTGGFDTKFGFGLAEGVAAKAVDEALSMPNVELFGIHAHIGSQIFALHSYAKAIEVIMDFLGDVRDRTGLTMREFDAGGGLGIKYEATDEPSTVDEFAEVIVDGVAREAGRLDLPVPKVMVEPGRSIVGNACVTLYRVGTVKEIPGVRTFVSVDGGMSDNLRPMLYGAAYEALLANRMNEDADATVTVAGKHCESGDVLVKEAHLPKPETGDVLCTPATGAYGYSMANNYNKQTRPAVVLVQGGAAKVIIRRETYDDLVRLDAPL